MIGLTDRQSAVLAFIVDYIGAKEYPPTVREISRHFGFSSHTAAGGHVQALIRKGFLDSDPKKARGLRVVQPLARP